MTVSSSRRVWGTCVLLVGLGLLSWMVGTTPLSAQRNGGAAEPRQKPVPRAECGKGDRVETGLQGQKTLAERMTGASSRSSNCKLDLVGQFHGEGPNDQGASVYRR